MNFIDASIERLLLDAYKPHLRRSEIEKALDGSEVFKARVESHIKKEKCEKCATLVQDVIDEVCQDNRQYAGLDIDLSNNVVTIDFTPEICETIFEVRKGGWAATKRPTNSPSTSVRPDRERVEIFRNVYPDEENPKYQVVIYRETNHDWTIWLTCFGRPISKGEIRMSFGPDYPKLIVTPTRQEGDDLWRWIQRVPRRERPAVVSGSDLRFDYLE